MCQSLGAEVHRLALQVQVLEESDTVAIEAEAVPSLHHTSCASAVSVVSSGSTVQSPCSCPCLIAGVSCSASSYRRAYVNDFEFNSQRDIQFTKAAGTLEARLCMHTYVPCNHNGLVLSCTDWPSRCQNFRLIMPMSSCPAHVSAACGNDNECQSVYVHRT